MENRGWRAAAPAHCGGPFADAQYASSFSAAFLKKSAGTRPLRPPIGRKPTSADRPRANTASSPV